MPDGPIASAPIDCSLGLTPVRTAGAGAGAAAMVNASTPVMDAAAIARGNLERIEPSLWMIEWSTTLKADSPWPPRQPHLYFPAPFPTNTHRHADADAQRF